MRVLFVSSSPICREKSIGNTFLNVFHDLEDVELASLYTRGGNPDPIISECFCITDKMLARNLLRGTPIGKRFVPRSNGECVRSADASAVVKLAKSVRLTVFYWAQELLWRVGRWRTKELQQFIEDFRPDIIFTVLSNQGYLNRMIGHVATVSGAKLVLYAWDNNYTYKQFTFSPLRWIKQFLDRISMRRLASRADRLYVICEGLKEDYERAFKRECFLLTKGGDFSAEPPVRTAYNHPLQLVYTGNIGLGRWKSLAKIAAVLERINQDGLRAQLRIYTGNPLTGRMNRALSRGETSVVMGSVPSAQVATIQTQADILVHVEATDLKNRLAVRHSFSTKIVDYLAAARPILAYGKRDVASIRHLAENDCAIVAESPDELCRRLTAVLTDETALDDLARRAYACGRRHHERADILEMLTRDFDTLLKRQDGE